MDNVKKINPLTESFDNLDFIQFENDTIEGAREIIDKLIADGVKPIITVPREKIDTILEKGLHEKRSWVGPWMLVGTIGKKPYQIEKNRVALIIDCEEKHLTPRFTGPDKKFHGVVGFVGYIPPEKISFLH